MENQMVLLVRIQRGGDEMIRHVLYWQLSDDEEYIEVHSQITIHIFGKVNTLSERTMKLPLAGEEGGDR